LNPPSPPNPVRAFPRVCVMVLGLLGVVPTAPVFKTFKPPPYPNWVPSLTGTLRPTLVLFCPPSSTCICVLFSSFELPLDCKRLRLVGGKPSRKPAPPIEEKAERTPTLPIPAGNKELVPKPPRLVSEVVFVLLKIGSLVFLSMYNGSLDRVCCAFL